MRRVITTVLLVFYGSVGILGYGLHDLFHVHHGHSHAGSSHSGHSHVAGSCSAASCCSRGCCSSQGHCNSSTGEENSSDDQAIVVATEEPCSICAFLAQAQELAPEFSDSQLVVAVPTVRPADEVLFPLYLPSEHLARGPPTCC